MNDFRKLILLIGSLTLAGWASLSAADASRPWQVSVDFEERLGPVPPYYASANINAVRRMLEQPDGFDEAVRSLGIRFMRFQVGGGLDYRASADWEDEDFAMLDEAVDKAYALWGVEGLMFCISGMSKPFDDEGRLIPEDIDAYAEACAEWVRRFAPPGDERVLYWEPFNEWDHGILNRMRAHGQDYDLVSEVFRRCAERMREVNPAVMVGGPSMTHANSAVLRLFLEHAGDRVDFVSWHDYATGSATSADAQVLRTITDSNRFVSGVRRIVEVVEEAGLTGVPLFMDEFHVNYRSWRPTDPRTVNDFAAVFVASVFANLAGSGVDGLFIHDVFGRHYGLLAPHDYDSQNARQGALFDVEGGDAIYVRPAGWVYRWFSMFSGGDWVASRVELPVEAAESERGPLLEALAWRSGERQVLMLVNKDTRGQLISIDWGDSLITDGYELPLAYRMINAMGPVKGRRSGTREGRLEQWMPAMSVCFLYTE